MPPPAIEDREPTAAQDAPTAAQVEPTAAPDEPPAGMVTTDRLARITPSPRRPEGRACPVCTMSNPPSRELCRRCGVDLETGRRLPQLASRPGRSAGRSPPPSRSAPVIPRVWWLAPVAALGVAAAIVIGLWFAQIGPFVDEPELPVARFIADRYPVDDPLERLALSDVATITSRAPEGERTFPVEQMVDADPNTAWHDDPTQLPEGVDEKVDLFLDEPAWISKVVINNGDHSDPTAYEAAGRIQRAALVMDGDVRMEIVLLDLGREPQAVTLPEPVLTTTIRLEIIDTLPGVDWDGIAISDLEVQGWVADDEDADLAIRRADVRQAAGSFTLPDRR